MTTLRGEVNLRPQPLHVAMAVGGVANQDDARQLSIADGEFLVNAQRTILESNRLGVLLAPVASREDVDAHDLELRGLNGTGVGGPAIPGNRRREHLPLLIEWGHKSVADAAM